MALVAAAFVVAVALLCQAAAIGELRQRVELLEHEIDELHNQELPDE